MNRRQALRTAITAGVGTSFVRPGELFARVTGKQAGGHEIETIYLHPARGRDTSSGAKDNPLKSLAEVARRVNDSTGTGATTVILSEGVYAVEETALFKPTKRSFAKDRRLTIRAEVLPDDPEWHTGRMPTLIHTLPLSPDWNGRPDPFGGVAYGMLVETSHVTIQGLKILGVPVVEHPREGAIYRVYSIGRNGRELDDLEIKQCFFAGDEVTNPNHLPILTHGNGIVLDHCVFHKVKQSIVYWTGGSTGHAMRNCLIYGNHGCGIWTSGIANDFDFRNNVIANSRYVWISQSARSASAEAGQAPRSGANNAPPPAGASTTANPSTPVRYRVVDSLFTGNEKLAGSGGGPALNFRDIDPSFLELFKTSISDRPLAIELDQTKRSYLHPVEGSEAARIGAGLFIKKT